MNKKLTTIVLASTLGLGALGAAALPAMASTTSPSPSASSSSGTSGSTTADADRQAEMQQRIADDLAGLVADGTITQEQADKVAETLASKMPAGGGHGGRGGHGGGFGGLETAATAIGITADELRTQLEAGKSVAQVAEAEGVSEQAVIDALVKAAEEHLAEEVASGEHTQAEADAKLADIEARITEMVETEGLPQRGGHDGRGPGATSDSTSGTATPSTSATSAA